MYKGICKEKGNSVDEESAFNYAILRILQGTEKEKSEFVEWFYSGDWIKEEEEDL